MLRVLARALMGFTIGAGAMVAGATAAHADGSIHGYDSTLWQGCSNYEYGYNLSYPGATSWDMEVTVYTPSGEYSDSSYSSGDGPAADGIGRANICEYEGVGRYSLEAAVTWYETKVGTTWIRTTSAAGSGSAKERRQDRAVGVRSPACVQPARTHHLDLSR